MSIEFISEKEYLLLDNKTAFIFEFDDVLYPQQDYLLQVYYLFTQFMEYESGIANAEEILQYVKNNIEKPQNQLLDKTFKEFQVPVSYKINFERLMVQAKLPLPLILYPKALKALKELSANGKKLFLLTAGNPLVQLNKIKQTDWQGLEKEIKIYFINEIKPKPSPDALMYLVSSNYLTISNVLFTGKDESDKLMSANAGIDFQSGQWLSKF